MATICSSFSKQLPNNFCSISIALSIFTYDPSFITSFEFFTERAIFLAMVRAIFFCFMKKN